MKIACKAFASMPLAISLFALSMALHGTCYAAGDPLLGVPSVANAKIAEAPVAAKTFPASASSSAAPTSGAGAVPSPSSSLASPSSALPLPVSSSPAASTRVAGSQMEVAAVNQPPSAVTSSSATATSLTSILSSGSTGTASVASSALKDDGKKDDSKSLNAIEGRVSDSVKDVVKRLGSMTETTTLDDINVARQAVAKLEAMIDIERRLSELEKMRNERNRASSGALSVAAAIPASALLPLPSAKQSSASHSVANGKKSLVSEEAKPYAGFSTSSNELSRIVGSNGRYRAVIKSGDGAEKTYRAGDKFSDGSIVLNITPTSVVLKKDGVKNTLRIKGVDMVFNGR